MKPQFNIQTPLSVADIERIRRRNDHKLRVTRWFRLPVAAGSLVTGWFFWHLGMTHFPYVGIEQAIVWRPILSAVMGLLACVIVFQIWEYWQEDLHDTKRHLKPLPLSDSEAALALTKQYADLDAYRKAVIVHRQLMTGDFEAMKSFANQQESVAAARALEEKQKEAFRKLHEVR